MASIGSTLPSLTAASTNTANSNNTSVAGDSNSLANQQTFLQLLVAQLQNQDPTQPVQGTEFITQLATFSNVEQSLAVRQDIDAISSKYLGDVPSGGTVASTAAAGTSSSGASGTDSTKSS